MLLPMLCLVMVQMSVIREYDIWFVMEKMLQITECKSEISRKIVDFKKYIFKSFVMLSLLDIWKTQIF